MDTPATMGMDTLYLHWEATDNLPFVLKGNTQLFPFLVVQPEKDSRLNSSTLSLLAHRQRFLNNNRSALILINVSRQLLS